VRGQIKVAGVTVGRLDPTDAVKLGLAFVPANRKRDGCDIGATIKANMLLPSLDKLRGRSKILRPGPEEQLAGRWGRRVHLSTRDLDRTVSSLSGGNQQKVVLAKWMMMDPKVYLLDEPTQGVDVGAKREIHNLIRLAVNDGAAVIICGTDALELAELCTRILVIRRGSVAMTLQGEQITADAITSAVYQVAA
jgi:ribose transport system ATP-binding protein